jgi:hypothetical protein
MIADSGTTLQKNGKYMRINTIINESESKKQYDRLEGMTWKN